MYIFPKYNIQPMKLKLDVQLNIPPILILPIFKVISRISYY